MSMIDSGLLELLESTVTIASPTSRGLDGKQAFGTAASYQAHISNRRDMVRNASGEEVMSNGSADLDSAYPDLRESDKITLPDGTTPTIVAISTSYDSVGAYQTTVYW